MRRDRVTGALALSVLLVTGAPAAAAELRVSVNGLRSADGVVRLALYDRPELFPEKGEGLKIAVPARQGEVEAVFDGLAPGRYALALFHDEDGDDEFDRGFLGIPKEGYAFSNDARPFLGPPSFDKAAVEVGEGGAAITIRMVY